VNAFTVVQDTIWSAGDDNLICVWDCKTFSLRHRLTGHQGAVYGIETVGDYVWTSGWDTTIRIWDSMTYETVCELTDFNSDCVSSIQLLQFEDEKFVCTGSWDKSICIFKATDKRIEDSKRIGTPVGAASEDEKKINEAENKMEELKKRNFELAQRTRDLQLRRVELEERKKKLAERRVAMETKKKELGLKKTELEEKVNHIQQE